jgi:hypothetical protein
MATHAEYMREYRKTHPRTEETRRTNAASRVRVKEILRAAKSRPCADCGTEYPYYVMDFDHRPDEEKLVNLSNVRQRANSWNTEKLMREIAKCDVVCANCHRERTHQREQY